MLPACRPIHQGEVFARITKWEPGAADKAMAEIKREKPHFSLDGGSWTNNISWVAGYENLLTPMNKLSAAFHQVLDGKPVDTQQPRLPQRPVPPAGGGDELLPLLGAGRSGPITGRRFAGGAWRSWPTISGESGRARDVSPLIFVRSPTRCGVRVLTRPLARGNHAASRRADPGIRTRAGGPVAVAPPARTAFAVSRGHCRPFGPTPRPGGVNFAVFSRHAQAVHAGPVQGRPRRAAGRDPSRPDHQQDRRRLARLRPRPAGRTFSTATASAARSPRRPAIASTRRPSCSIPTPRPLSGGHRWGAHDGRGSRAG